MSMIPSRMYRIGTVGCFARAWGGLLLGVMLRGVSAWGGTPEIPLYDQISTSWGPGEPKRHGILLVATNAPLGQSFVPTHDGLDFIELTVGMTRLLRPAEQEALRVDLRGGGVGGPIIDSTTPVMVTFAGEYQWLGLTFRFPDRVPLTPGAGYFFEVVHVAGSSFLATIDFIPGSYQSGQMYWQGRPQGLSDLWFSTGQMIPEPSAGALLLLGGLGLCWAVLRPRGNPDRRGLPGGDGRPDHGV